MVWFSWKFHAYGSGLRDEGSASRRKSDVGISGSRRKSDAGSASRRRSNVGKEPARTSSPSEVENEQAYAEQCHMCAETALNYFNNLAITQWVCVYILDHHLMSSNLHYFLLKKEESDVKIGDFLICYVINNIFHSALPFLFSFVGGNFFCFCKKGGYI